MAKIYVFLADGFELIEAMAPVDILRRGGQEVTTVSIMDRRNVMSAQQQEVLADALFSEVTDFGNADWLILPGGMPGAEHLCNHDALRELLYEHDAHNRHFAAICAAPMVLGRIGLLSGHRATCYPGFEKFLLDATYTAEPVTIDGRFTTAYGPGAALAFGYAILQQIVGEEAVAALKSGMMYKG